VLWHATGVDRELFDALVPYGWDDGWRALAADSDDPQARPGRVARIDRGRSTVVTADGPVRVALAPAWRDADPVDLPAVGDWVLVADRDDDVAVTAVLPRRSAFVRGTSLEGDVDRGQVVAANVDLVLLVQSLAEAPNLRRLERELVLAWESGATPVVVLSKADLCDDVAAAVTDVERVVLGTDVVVTSAVRGDGIAALARMASAGRTVAFVGASGVGKSTLVNRLLGDESRRTTEVREHDQRGRHTTTARELVVLPSGGILVDTPGLRALALWEADEGIERAFADVTELASRCRFRDCAHGTEPGCAVRDAVEAGTLDPDRLASYRRLVAELDAQDARAAVRARSERDRAIRLAQRAYRKIRKR